jgi:iron complex outermembrane receptor protein
MKNKKFTRKLLTAATLLLSLLLSGGGAMAQQRITVAGTVVDAQGEPVIGASVVEKGTTVATSTGPDGKFTLSVSAPEAVLVFNYLGYKQVERPASAVGATPVALEEDQMQLDEVVVIGYGTVKKKDLTGSVNTVRAEEINRGAVTSAQEMLMGKAPGVLVTLGDGGPGSGSTIRVRGGSSLRASNDPLIVIDGVPVSNDAAPGMANGLALLNPNDIESFSILKDASATAIYGSRASNGVIMITTKKGQAQGGSGQKVLLTYNSSYSVVVNSKRFPTMTADEYRSFMLTEFPEGTDNGSKARSLMGDASTDWQAQVFRPAFATDQNLSALGNVSVGGIMKMPYRVSLGYASENGTLKTSHVQNGNVNVSLSPSFLDDHLNVTLNAKGIYSKNSYADGGTAAGAAYFDPTHDVYFRNADGSIDYTRANGYFSWFDPIGGATPNSLSDPNPMARLYDQYNNSDAYRFLGNVQVDYKLHWLPELRLNLNLAMDETRDSEKNGVSVGSFFAMKDNEARDIGKYHKEAKKRSNELIDFYASYAKDFDAHRVDAMAGYSWQHFYTENDGIDYFNVTNDVWNDAPLWATEYYLLSFFGRLNYSYGGKYLATFSLRDDASSRFSKDNRWGLFPAAAVAWTISEEDFLKSQRLLSSLKLRLGWGMTGQQEINAGDYPYLARYNLSTSPGTSYNMGDGYYPVLKPDAYDENIKWETTETYNAGIDYGFLRGRINGSLDFYFRRTHDLLNEVNVPLGSNFSNRVLTNVGNMENKGVELSIGAVILQSKDFTWDAGFNITWQDTKITKLLVSDNPDYFIATGGAGFGTGNEVQLFKVGYTPYSFHLFQQVYRPDGQPVQNALVDRNPDGQTTPADKYISGKKATPDVFFGLNSKVTWKEWDFGFNAHASLGNWMFNSTWAQNSTTDKPKAFLVQNQLNNLSTLITKTGFTGTNTTEQQLSDLFLEDASFFRMDDITLGYTVRDIAGTKLSLRSAFTVQNVFVLTGYSGMDPEIYGGIDNGMWPRPRTFSLRLGLTF